MLLDTIYNVHVPIESMSPVAVDGTFTRRFLKNPTPMLAELEDRHSSIIESVRGEGLMFGLKTRVPNAEFAAAARAARLLTIPASDNVVRLLPPLIVGESELAEAARRLGAACATLESAGAVR